MKSLTLLKANSVVMDIQVRKYNLIEKVMRLNESQLDRIESTLQEEMELDHALDRAIDQVKEGKVKPHSEIRKKYQQWL